MHAIEKDKQDLHTYKDKNKDSKRHAFTSLFTYVLNESANLSASVFFFRAVLGVLLWADPAHAYETHEPTVGQCSRINVGTRTRTRTRAQSKRMHEPGTLVARRHAHPTHTCAHTSCS